MAGSKQKTILLADDDRTTRTVITKILEEANYRVDQAERGEKSLFMALERDYDAFLIDINMPGLSGLELCKRLRDKERYRITPIIFITSMEEDESLDDVFAVGATDFINKPVSPVVLRARLASHLERVAYYKEAEKVREYLNRYISAKTQRMVEAYALTGLLPSPELQNVCVMFTDIRGFTSFSQDTDLDLLFSLISKHLGTQVQIVHEHGGYIDKFGGDGMMAIFEGDDMVERACCCALNIIDAVYAAQSQTDGVMINLEGVTLPLGIGIHTGDVLIGNIGSQEHLDYSVLGETVNLASRLCGQADAMTVDVSEAVMKAAKNHLDLIFSAPTQVTVKGASEAVNVYTLKWSAENTITMV